MGFSHVNQNIMRVNEWGFTIFFRTFITENEQLNVSTLKKR